MGKNSQIRTGWFKYVRYADVAEYEGMGWMIVASLGHYHGQWAVLMWHCDCGL